MFQIEWPLVMLLLPLPLLVYFGMPAAAIQRSALRVPFIDDFRFGSDASQRMKHRQWQLWLSLLAWTLLVIAGSRPQWLGESIAIPVSGRDLMLAVDLSESMERTDFEIDGEQVDRLFATKHIAREFIERRRGDRLGLILFGSQAYLQTPLTFDTKTINQLLQEAVIGLAGKRTAIGDAIGLTLKRLQSDSDTSQVLILMTDGANTAGEVTPQRAAQLASDRGLKIYTIGIGAEAYSQWTLFGSRTVNPSKQLDERMLRNIATISGGQYFRARDAEELAKIYGIIDQLEPLFGDQQQLRPIRALYPWPLALAMAFALLLLLQRRASA